MANWESFVQEEFNVELVTAYRTNKPARSNLLRSQMGPLVISRVSKFKVSLNVNNPIGRELLSEKVPILTLIFQVDFRPGFY